MIVIHKRRVGTNAMEYWKQVPDIASMCTVLETRRQNVYSIDKRPGTTVQPFVAIHLDTAKPVMVLQGGEAYYAITLGRDEIHVLNLGTRDDGTFTLPMNVAEGPDFAKALAKLQARGWIVLIDVLPMVPPYTFPPTLFRVFALSPMAIDWVLAQEPAPLVDRAPRASWANVFNDNVSDEGE